MFEEVVNILKNYTMVDPEEMSMESELVAQLGLNSLHMVELIIAFEETFDVVIPDRKISKLHSIGDVVFLLETLCE